jgi:hypothetical protein
MAAASGFHALKAAPVTRNLLAFDQHRILASNLAGQAKQSQDMSDVETGAYRLLVNVSTNQRLGTPFRLSAAVLRLGRADRYRGPITFRSSDPHAIVPRPYLYSSNDDLYESHLFEATLRSEGHHVITIREEELGTEFSSNVIVVAKLEPEFKLYFGDVHIHSQWSVDGRREPDYSYIYARDAMNLDFACLTEHDPAITCGTGSKQRPKNCTNQAALRRCRHMSGRRTTSTKATRMFTTGIGKGRCSAQIFSPIERRLPAPRTFGPSCETPGLPERQH